MGGGWPAGVLPWLAAVAGGLAVWWAVPPPPLERLRPDRVGEAVAAWRADGAAWIRRRRLTRVDRNRAAALRASVPAVCDLLAACLDAGRPPRTALRVVVGVLEGPPAEELAAVLQRIDLGVDEAEAWGTLSDTPGYREVGRDLARSVRSGVGLATLLRQHAGEARKEAAAAALVAARGAGVRSVVPMMLCFLPAFLLLGVVPMFGSIAAGLVP